MDSAITTHGCNFAVECNTGEKALGIHVKSSVNATSANGGSSAAGLDAGDGAIECNLLGTTAGSDAGADESTLVAELDASVGSAELDSQSKPQLKIRKIKKYPGLCPMCGVTKKLSQTGNCRVVAIASQADPATVPLFDTAGLRSVNGSFRVCKICYHTIHAAIKVVCESSVESIDL